MNAKILSYIGLACKAGAVVSGEFAVEKAVKSQTVYLVLVAEDASENTKKLFFDKCNYREIPCHLGFRKEELGKACGKELRASVGILDEGFAKAIEKLL